MTQYVINIGAIPNDGTGDPLRTAFNETNLNFNQVFAAGPVLSNIRIANNNIFTTNTNGNLVLNPNGIGVVQANAHVVPNLANIRNLGSATRRWSELYVQYANIAGSVDLTGTLGISGDLTVGGNLTVVGNTIQIGNITTETKTIQLANAASTANAATGSGVTVGVNDDIATMLYSSASNAWVFNIGLDTPNIVVNNISSDDSTFVTIQDGLDVQGSITAETVSAAGNITGAYFIGNGSQLTGLAATYGNANAVAYGESGWAGNIIPNGNAVYSLGNATNQWNDLYVSNATIFMNNVPISLSAGNVLTVNGNAVLTNGSNTAVSTTGNITAGNIGITGGSLTWANASIVQTSASDVSITGDGQVTVRSLDGTYQWTFESTGNLTLPGATAGETIATQGGYITVGNLLIGQGGALFNSNNDSWALYGNLSDPGATIFIPSNADAGNGTPLYIESQQSNVEIRSGSSTWNFDTLAT
jgi:cytoskeletal protein CcmA (bactofilin family)